MRIRSLLVAACSMVTFAMSAAAQDPLPHQQTVSATVSALPAPAPNPAPLFPLSMLAFALIGATEKSEKPKSRKMNLAHSYTFGGQTYGPGVDIEVPGDFPEIDGETGDVVHPPGSAAARNAYSSKRLATTAPSTGGVDTGEPPAGASKSGKTGAELEAMSKAELVELADKKGITVTRSDGEEGEPLKGDYVKALSA